MFNVTPEKERQLRDRMSRLGIREADLEEQFLRGRGPGGQKINKTSAVVRLLHRPTGIEVRCGRERSQALNRFLARRALCDCLEAQREGVLAAEKARREKIRRQKRRRSRRQQAYRLAEKRAHSEKKVARTWRPSPEDGGT